MQLRIALLFGLVFHSCAITFARQPNFVLIFTDNLGYGDIGCFGSTVNRTPNIDQMAREGLKLTSFYVGSSVCTPSRAAIMTGCYPMRVNMDISGTRRVVLQPVAQKGLAPSEITIADVLKQQGYATACFGKWHLGDQPQFLPTNQGFDRYLGVPYSEDMIATTGPRLGEMWPPLPLMRDTTVIDAPVDPNRLTKLYTEAAVDFIQQNAEQPFFLYLPHAVPGSSVEAFASESFRERSQSGTYGACIEELDWSTGEILKTIRQLGIDEHTMVIWTSDNGAFQGRRLPPHGQNTPLRGTGGSGYEGGYRVPFVVRWPGHIPAGASSDELVTSMDLLPTMAKLSGGQAPDDRKIDGMDVWPVLSQNAESPHDVFYYYLKTQLRAVRSGDWKLHLPVNLSADRPSVKPIFAEIQLYDLKNDFTESNNVADDHPEIVQRLMKVADKAREELGDIHRVGTGQRPAGWVDNVISQRLPGLPSVRGYPSDAKAIVGKGIGLARWSAKSLDGWKAASSVGLDVDDAKRMVVSTVAGDAVIHNLANDPNGKQRDAYLMSSDEFGDMHLHLEYLLTEGSNSGVYVMGRYELQLRDSFGIPQEELDYNDSGGIYQHWDEQREPKGYGGTAPRLNASRPAGEWESMDIVFRAPRFDPSGEKTSDATFVEVKHNGKLIHENVRCTEPTRAPQLSGEAARGPIVIQGNHGPVALRNVWIRDLE
tara:strand:+ start:70931 stop:73057 length:2127 start_codon:yes stop_codon:yes gene_type:complete